MSGVEVATMIRSIGLGVAAGGLQRPARGDDRKIAGHDLGRSEMARTDAGALDDPCVRSLDAVACEALDQGVVGDPVGRQVAAGAGDARVAVHDEGASERAVSNAVGSPPRAAVGNAASVATIRVWTRSSKPFRAAS